MKTLRALLKEAT
jgi:hypothetical protein